MIITLSMEIQSHTTIIKDRYERQHYTYANRDESYAFNHGKKGVYSDLSILF